MNDKKMDERIARYINNQTEYSVNEEMEAQKEELMAELAEGR